MANRSTLDPDKLPGNTGRKAFKGHDNRSLGPSDSSDTGSDLAGQGSTDDDMLGLDQDTTGLDDTTDRQGTGERLTAGEEPDVRIGSDIGLDRIVGPEEAGLGGGLDQAEEAQLGITDEELAEMARTRSPKK
jgi:hypothetical protein